MTKYPLSWPDGWKRTPASARKRAKFNKKSYRASSTPGMQGYYVQGEVSIAEGTKRVLNELAALGVQEGDAIISTNLRIRLDGLPRSDQREPLDIGVAVYWNKGPERQTKVIAIDMYDRVADNLAAIAASLEAMRAIERHGGATILDRAFMGFEALPAPKGWREILGVESWTSWALNEVGQRYRNLAIENHPDRGGSHERMTEINAAWEQAQKELGGV